MAIYCNYTGITTDIIIMTIMYNDVADFPVANPTDPDDWYAAGLNGIVFSTIEVSGNSIIFKGFNPGDFALNASINKTKIIRIIDEGLVSTLSGAMINATLLETIVFPLITAIPDAAFYQCIALYQVSAPEVVSVGDNAFEDIANANISFPVCTSIGLSSFAGSGILSAELPLLLIVKDSAFQNTSALTTVIMTSVTLVENQGFDSSGLTTINLPAATEIQKQGFYNCGSLLQAMFPEVITLGNRAIAYCAVMTDLTIPKVTTLGERCLAQNSSLFVLDIPLATTYTESKDYMFDQSGAMTIFNAPLLPSVGANAFENNSSIQTINLQSCVDLGGTVNIDFVFNGIVGKVITLNVPAVLATCAGGFPDQDIQLLEATNTVTVNYI